MCSSSPWRYQLENTALDAPSPSSCGHWYAPNIPPLSYFPDLCSHIFVSSESLFLCVFFSLLCLPTHPCFFHVMLYLLRISYMNTMYFNHIYPYFLLQFLPESLPFLSPNVMSSFLNTFSPVTAVIEVGLQPFTGACAIYQEPSLKKIVTRYPSNHQSNSSEARSPALGTSASIHGGMCTCLILHRSCVG